MQDAPKVVWSIPYLSVTFFPSLKQNSIAYCSSKMSSRPDCIFEIDQLWQSGFIGQSSHKMYSNNIVNFQVSTTILNACTKKVWKLIEYSTYTHTHTNIYIYIYTHTHTHTHTYKWVCVYVHIRISSHVDCMHLFDSLSLHPSLSNFASVFHVLFHGRTSLRSSCLLIRDCPACLVCLT